MLEGLGELLIVMAVLSLIGIIAVLGGSAYAIYWLVNHLAWVS